MVPGWLIRSLPKAPFRLFSQTANELVAQPERSRLLRYGVAVVSVLTMLWLMLWLDRWVPMQGSPFLLLFAAVMVSAWYGGLGPGVFATLLSAIVANYFFIQPLHSLVITSWSDGIRLILFGLVSLLISNLSALRRTLVKALSRERDLVSAIITTAGSLILVLDRQGKIVQFNRACEQITGYRSRDVRDRWMWDFLIPPEEIAAVRQVFQRLQMGILPSQYEGDWIVQDGSRRRIAWTNTVLHDDRGRVSYVIATGIDITDRYRAEQALQSANQTLEALIQASPLAITVLDRQGRVKLWNPAAERIFGWTAEEAIGRIMPSVPTEKQAEFQRNIENTFRGEFQNGIEVKRQRKDGSTVYISLWAAILRDVQGEDECLLSVVADVSDRYRAEAALKTMQARLTSFFDANLIGILFGHVDGRIENANDEFLRMVGRSREELLLGTVRWDTMTPPEFAAIDQQHIAEATLQGTSPSFEKEYIRSDGSRIPVLVGFTFVDDDRQQVVAFILDLTEQKRLEQALRQQAEELAQSNRMKDEFLAVLSHELRTPLNSILGWAQLLKNRDFDPATRARALETIERNARSQTQLIEDILDVAKVIQGKLRINPRSMPLAPVVDTAIEAMRPAASAKQVQLVWSNNSTVAPIYGDPDRLQQVVWNLISNAIKFTPEGGRVTVKLEEVRSGRVDEWMSGRVNENSPILPAPYSSPQPPTHAQIQVIDTGKGIRPDFLPYVFDRFRQADSTTTRSDGGLGLGLAIVRHLVELHGGTVQAQSNGEGQGATFTVRLPLLPRTKPAIGSSPSNLSLSPLPKTPLHPTPARSLRLLNRRVLVVDDDGDTCEFLRAALEEEGAIVTVANSAAAALHLMMPNGEKTQHCWQPDVIISDIGMPHEDGYMLLKKLRSLHAQGAEIPTVALTAYAREEDCEKALTAGFDRFLTKPIQPDTLAEALVELLH